MLADEINAALAAKADALLRRSAEDMAALLHPDFVYVNSSGRKLDKAGYVDNGCTSGRIRFVSQKVSELDVRLFGDMAVATMVLDDHYFVQGHEIKAIYKSLCVFARTDGKWLWCAGQTMSPA
ncbi:MAG TPA: nuclear transport factor 2 family protein [Reyranella sp.]|nr:nuclear transport factor 2 family protein [Reyranella sp.]